MWNNTRIKSSEISLQCLWHNWVKTNRTAPGKSRDVSDVSAEFGVMKNEDKLKEKSYYRQKVPKSWDNRTSEGPENLEPKKCRRRRKFFFSDSFVSEFSTKTGIFSANEKPVGGCRCSEFCGWPFLLDFCLAETRLVLVWMLVRSSRKETRY